MAGSRRTATRVTPGAICLSSSSHFPLMPYSNCVKPVALPPGRARLSTKPAPTGSGTIANTIGTVRVACSNGPTAEPPVARMTSGASATNSAACLRSARRRPAVAQRVSIRTLRPMVQPNCCRLLQERRDAGLQFRIVRGCGPTSTPMRRIRSPCCARAASGHATAAPPRSVMNSRRFIRSPRRRGRAASAARRGRAPWRS